MFSMCVQLTRHKMKQIATWAMFLCALHFRIRRSLASFTHARTHTHMNAPANKLNVHFDHRICLFLSDLLLMSDCFHVSCALHFYSLSETKAKAHHMHVLLPSQHKHTFTFALLLLHEMRRKFDPHTLVPVTEKNSHSLCHALYACGLAWQIKYRKK